jgi:signal transduction histidine kinase
MPDQFEWRILLIDDEQDILDVVGMALKDAGYLIATSSDGEAGLAACAQDPPHIVITDIRMPGIDGIQVLARIKERHPFIEVIVATAFAEMKLAVQALQLDASDFITKPIAADALLVAVERAKQRYAQRKKLQDYTAFLEAGWAETTQELQQVAHQAHILHQDKMMSLGRLAASVAHEINNPLSGVLNYIRLMNRIVSIDLPGPEQIDKFKSYLTIVEKEIQRCARIVSNLLTFARTSDVIFKPVDVRELIEQCLVLSGHRLELSNIETKIHISQPTPAVQGDANQLQQCLLNLVFNAMDAMPDGGLLEIAAGCGENRGTVIITVADNGCGIAPEDLSRIFDPFFTTKQEGRGTGLGLSTTYGIIGKHKGTIDVQSRPGRGTTFTIKLPATQRPLSGLK